MKRLWYRFLAWTFDRRRDAYVRIELVGNLDGPVVRTVPLRDAVLAFTHNSVYLIQFDYTSFVSVRRVA